MTEAEFQGAVLGIAKMYAWAAYHTHDSRRSNPGWPDLVLCRPPRLLFIELKSEKGRLSAAQRFWLRDLAASGQEVAVFRPSDLPSLPEYLGPRARRLPGPPL